MNKICILALAIAAMPLNQAGLFPKKNRVFESKLHVFPYKNNITTNPFCPEKKPGENWTQDWISAAQENIRKSEYYFTWQEKLNAYCTPNRKNNLRFFYTDKGFTVEPRTTKIPEGNSDPLLIPDEIKYKTIPNLPAGQASWKVKINLDKKQIGKGKWELLNNRANYITDNITVQYINDEEGMRQNFIVHKPLSKNSSLKINFQVKTKLKPVLKNNQLSFYQDKTEVLQYKDLNVWDAKGTRLEASIKKNKGNRFYIEVETKDAMYPITIDPLSTTPSIILEGNQDGAWFGRFVSSAGDVNGDGYSDVIVTAQQYDNGEMNEGAAFIFHGSSTGISSTAAAMVESNQVGANMGRYGTSAGDVNGDGYSDVIVGAEDYSNGQSAEGAAFIYLGSATGINTTPATILECNQAGARFGYSVASAGDVNGDGYSDVIVGCYFYNNGQNSEGAAFVYHGSVTGINNVAAAIVESNQVSARMGNSVASAGDINGDGYSDIIVGAFGYANGQADEGVAFIYMGASGGINTTPSATLEKNQENARFGQAVSSAGDVNGDGYGDIIVGAYEYDNGQTNEGAAFIYHGSAVGINTASAATLENNLASAWMGFSVACAGDINGDGYSDVIVGAPSYNNGQSGEGVAFVYIGSGSGIINTMSTSLESNQANALLGWSVGCAGDINGDGYSDVIAGAFRYDNGQTDEGAAFVYHGAPGGLIPGGNITNPPVAQNGLGFGHSVAGAGDINGDGYSDVIIGSYGYDDGFSDEGRAFVYYGSATGLPSTPNLILDNGNQTTAYFGFSVAGAGDVNADGYSDVVVGAYLYDDGFTDEGRAWVYHGSASGLSAVPARVLDDANQAGAGFGVEVAGAGDVNGDGYSDLIIGAYSYDDGPNTNEGRAYVYYGSASGIPATANIILSTDANQINAYFGRRVATAGDVDGDGFGDLIVSATNYNGSGAAFCYFGSAAGLIPVGSLISNASQPGEIFGASIACAGDINGDGYNDVIISGIFYNNERGRVYVYHGSPAGLPAVPNLVLDNNQSGSNNGDRMGYGISGAGDINGDGYSDVIVGVPQYDQGANVEQGRVFIYHGSTTGLPANPATILSDANQTNEFFGVAVACAGDINGDGYSDVIVGADHGSWPTVGRCFVYYGNANGGKRNNLRLYNTDLTTPINNSNFILGNFGAGLFAKSFLGRAKGKLVWETRLNFDPFSGTPITNSAFFTDQQGSYTNLGTSGTELKNLVNKIWYGGKYTKLRARVKYDPVTAITGQLYGPWRYVSSIIDANSLGALPVDLISFKATWLQKGKTAQLNFTTDKENGICCFTIEKSHDGFNFFPIGTVAAKNTASLQQYSYIDDQAKNKNQFYRLKIKGHTGNVEYSNIQQLQYSGSSEILVFPNPTTDVLQLQLNAVYEKLHVRIINSSGQVVKMMLVPVSNQILSIPVQNLVAGTYWLHLQTDGEKQVLQFVKQ